MGARPTMDVLLCWSKERSRLVARGLHEWLPTILPAIAPWMSELDLDKGKDWFAELHNFLADAKAVIVCITPENVRSPWIYYESGHVAGRMKSNLVCPYLLDEQPSVLADGPLGRMQCTKAEKEDTFQLLRTLNRSLAERSLDEGTIGSSFERGWPSLFGSLKRISDMEVSQARSGAFIKSDADDLAGADLSSEARTMVVAVGKDKHGIILRATTSSGSHFQTNGKDLNENGDARSTARWREALNSLLRLQLLEMRGNKGEVFALTAKGFRLFDLLTKSQ